MKFLNSMETLDKFSVGTFAASFTPDISASAIVKVSLTGGMTVNAPTGRAFGIFTLVFAQDATGGRALVWNTTDYPDFSSNNWQPSLGANDISSISFLYDANSSKWRPFHSWNGDVWAFSSGSTPSTSNRVRIGNQTLSTDGTKITCGALSPSSLTSSGTIQGFDMVASTHTGGSGSGGSMTLRSTSSATKGKINLGTSAYDEANNRLGIANSSPAVALDVTGAANVSTSITSPTHIGSSSASGTLTLQSTSNATKGKILFGTSGYDEVNNRLGIANSTPGTALDVTGAGTFSSTVTAADPTASTHLATKNYVDARGGAYLKARVSSNQTSMASTTYADVTGLSVSLPSTGYYIFRTYISFQCTAGTAPTITFGITGPTAVVCQYNVSIQTAAAGTNSVFTAGSYLQNTNLSASVATGTTFGAIVDGFVEVSATGTLKLQYKTGGASQAFSVFTGSMLQVEKILY